MHCFNLTASYAVLTKLVALRLECVHYRLNWAEKGVVGFFSMKDRLVMKVSYIANSYEKMQECSLKFENYDITNSYKI